MTTKSGGFVMSILARFLIVCAVSIPTAALANPSHYTLQCDTGSYFPTGVNATMTERSDLVAFKTWCEKAGTSTLAITMQRTGEGFVFESEGYGSTRDARVVETRTRATRLPWAGFSNNRTEFGIRPRPGAQLSVLVDVSEQSMNVTIDGRRAYRWPVSTARPGKYTPRGSYGVQWLSKNHRSSLYDGAPMPFAIFFNGNFAIHGTDAVNRIGTPASAGCVRLLPSDAARLFEAVQIVGRSNVSIKIVE